MNPKDCLRGVHPKVYLRWILSYTVRHADTDTPIGRSGRHSSVERGYVSVREWGELDAGLLSPEEMVDRMVSRCLCGVATPGSGLRESLQVMGVPSEHPPVPAAVLSWRGGTVVQVARAIQAEGRFDDLPVLADALEDAGCTDADLLNHCREPRHWPGCWALALLGGNHERRTRAPALSLRRSGQRRRG